MDDSTTPTPTPTPPKSIDGMTPGTKSSTTDSATAAPTAAPKPIDINSLDGDGMDATSEPVVTKTDSDGMTSTAVADEPAPVVETPAPEMPVATPPEAPKPSTTFDAKAAEAAMADEDAASTEETPASLSAGGPKITNSMSPEKPKKKGK